jgi:hypothetical protein
MQNPLRTKNVYLRRKSALMRDYISVGGVVFLVGLFAAFQYRKINPIDPQQ